MEKQNKQAGKYRRQRCARTRRAGHQREPEGADPLVLHTLTPREEKIMRMRFDLEDDSEHTLE
jgi:DNA-directed RNA polymerase sigma subunit (sigma70/sigma32)